MTVVGITGTSGSGKSTVAGIIQQNYNAQIIDADQIAKELTQQDTEYLRKITKTFGEEILENGKLNRKKLADIIFSDKKQKEKIDKLTQKYVVDEIKKQVKESKNKLVLLDVPLLFETKLNEIKEEKLSTELNFLRSQINPHFLFNVMNTIYFQISKENKKARQLVEIISDMLRYQLYECTAPKVDIEKELEYLNNYIYIKKFKKGFRGNIELTIDPDVRCRSIAPLLIQPIVENAFNYLEITRNNKVMYFNITNYENNGILIQISNEGAAIPNGSYITDDTQLINFKRRLEILYPDQHSFAHHKDKAHYFSKLILNHG